MYVVVENAQELSVRIPENTDWFGGVFSYFALNMGTATVTIKYKL